MERTGTFWCLLWGHKFAMWSTVSDTGEKKEGSVYLRKVSFCVRCGYTPKE